MTPFVRGVRAAFVFLTRVPVGGFPYSRADWSWSTAHFPLVGATLGACLGGLGYALLPLGALAAAVLTLGVSLLLTGAFHEDGLADTSDALGGAYDRAKVLVILKDSRVGSFGAAAMVVSIAGRAALLATLGKTSLWAWPLVACGARVGPIWLMVALPYVTSEGAKSRDVTRARAPQALVASAYFAAMATAFAATEITSPSRMLALTAGFALVTAITGYRYVRRLGGITGDFLGATEQIGELMGFAVLAWGLA